MTGSLKPCSTEIMKDARYYQSEIDGLRAIAVLAVIVFHFSEELLPSGFLGVDIFFVISGYVISKSISRYSKGTLVEQLGKFYARRVKRLLPALIVCVLFSGLLACLFIQSPAQTIATGVFALFGLSNIFLFLRSTDYFGDSASSNFFTHTWSLGVEEQFYFVYPLLFFWFVTRWQRKDIFNAILGLGICLSALMFLYGMRRSPGAAFYLMPFRFWEMGVGAVAFFWSSSRDSSQGSKPLWRYGTLVVVCAIVVTLFLNEKWTVVSTFLVVFLTALFLSMLNISNTGSSFLKNRYLVHIGLISYSLYLWHWSVIVFAYWTVGISMYTAPLLIILVYLLAVGSYYFVETPLRQKHWHTNNVTTVVYGVIGGALAAGAMFYLLDGRQSPSRVFAGAVDSEKRRSYSSLLLKYQNTEFIIGDNTKSELSLFFEKRKRCHMTPHRLNSKSPLYGEKPEITGEFLDQCTRSSQRQVLVVGDSFSSVVADHLYVAASKLGMDTNILYGYGCPFPLVPDYYRLKNRQFCDVISSEILDALARNLKQGDILVIRSFFQGYNKRNTSARSVNEFDSALDNLQNLINGKGAYLVVFGTNGTLTRTMPCTRPQWYNSSQCPDKSFAFDMMADNSNSYSMSFNQHLVQKYTGDNSVVIDPIEILCDMDGFLCPAYVNETLYYQDNDFNHLSNAAIDLLVPEIDAVLQDIVDSN